MKLSDAMHALSAAGIEDSRQEARIIFSHFDALPMTALIGCDIESTNPLIPDAVSRRAKREPLQYIIGEVGFYRECYKVSPACLIPRSDTELLVDYAVANIKPGARFLDICTGSGCVAISTLKNTKNTRAVAIDLSSAALDIAKENANRMDVRERVEFLHCDALDESIASALGAFDAILSNPPYVKEAVYQELAPEIFHEPRMAFVAGADGGDFYRALTPIYKRLLSADGFIAYEIGYDSEPILKEVALECNMSLEILRDISDVARVAVLRHRG